MEILKNYISKFKTFGDNLFRAKAFNIAKNPKNDGYQRGLASMVYKFVIKILLVAILKLKIFLIQN